MSGGSVRGTVKAALARIDRAQPALQAFQHVAAGRALARADDLDRADAPTGPLHGVPLAIKDNIVMRGVPTTAGSKILEGYQSPYDASVVDRLERAGAVIVGTTRCDEFAMAPRRTIARMGPRTIPGT